MVRGPARPTRTVTAKGRLHDRDDDVDLAEVPEADAAEQQTPLDPDDLPDAGEEEGGSVLEHASEADVLEQRQAVGGDEDSRTAVPTTPEPCA